MILARSKQTIGLRANRKTIVKLSVLVAVLFVAFLFWCGAKNVAYAGDKTKDEVQADLSKAVQEVLERLNLDALQNLIDSLGSEEQNFLSVQNVKDTISVLTSGNGYFFERLFSVLGITFGRYFFGFLPSFITIIVICILKSMLSGMTASFLDNSTTEVVHIVCYAGVITVLTSGVIGIIKTVVSTINAMSKFAEAVFPVILTLLSSVGGATSVATYSPMLAVLSGGIIKIIVNLIVPAFIATIVFSVVGNLSKTVKLDKLTGFIKTASTWLISVVFGLFATFLTVQGIAGGVVDKFGFNVAKFALSGYVPILGGYLSDGFDLISASIVIVKNAFGYFASMVLVGIVVFPLLKVMAFSLTLRFVSAIVEPIGDERVAKLLHSLAANINLLITALAGVGFLFFIMTMLMTLSCNMGL